MSDFPVKNKRTHWSVWRADTWLGEWHKEPYVGQTIKPQECLLAKTIVRIDREAGRIYVK